MTEQANFRHLVLDRLWFGLAMASGRFMAVYAIHAGAGALHLSWMSSAPGMMMFVATFLSIPWRTRHANSVKAALWPSLGSRLGFLLPAFTPFMPPEFQAWWLVLAAGLPALAEGIAASITLAVMRESITEGRMTGLLSARQTLLYLAAGGGAAAYGAWLDRADYPINYQAMYLVAFGFSLLSLWHIWRTQPLLPPDPIQAHPPNFAAWREVSFRRIALLIFVMHAAYYSVTPLLPLHLVNALGADEAYIAVYSLIELAAGTFAAATSAYLIPRLGHQRMIGLALVGTGIGAGMIALGPVLGWGLAAAGLLGACWSWADIGQFGLFSRVVPKQNSTLYTTPYLQLLSLSLFIGPQLGGLLAENGVTVVAVLMGGAILRVLAAVFVWRWRLAGAPESGYLSEAGELP